MQLFLFIYNIPGAYSKNKLIDGGVEGQSPLLSSRDAMRSAQY